MIGPVSGCHVNPAVTLGMVLARRMTPIAGVLYWVAQFAGGIIGAVLLHWIASAVRDPLGGGPFARKSFGSPGWGKNSDLFISAGGAFLVEIILTAVLVLVVLGATRGPGTAPIAGLAIGAVLAAIHLVGIPLTGTSVNPAPGARPGAVRRQQRVVADLAVHRRTAGRVRRRGRRSLAGARRAGNGGGAPGTCRTRAGRRPCCVRSALPEAIA